MDSFLQFERLCGSWNAFRVSILVLMDSFLQCYHDRIVRAWRINVSILVLMDSFLQYCHAISEYHPTVVSILVLMDSFLQLFGWLEVMLLRNCFNPCFNGFLSSIAGSESSRDRKSCFNPCFNGFLSSIIILPSVLNGIPVFQSLF